MTSHANKLKQGCSATTPFSFLYLFVKNVNGLKGWKRGEIMLRG
jgi:hypothetical protein